MIDSDRLASFIAFGEELNFTRAAARLHLSQPALHVQIRRLAEDLGDPLYRRVGRGLELTLAGRELLGFGRELRDRTDSFLASLKGDNPQSVVLASGEGALLYALGPAVRKAAQQPGTRLRVLTRDRDGTLAALVGAEAHLGVTTLEVVPEGMEAVLLRRSSPLVVMPRGHALSRRRRIQLADLTGERLILPPASRPHRALVTRALEAAQVRWELAVEASGWELMLHYAALGMGLAIVNDICRVPAGALGRPLAGLPPISYYVVHARRAPLSAPAEKLKGLIVESFGRPRPR